MGLSEYIGILGYIGIGAVASYGPMDVDVPLEYSMGIATREDQ